MPYRFVRKHWMGLPCDEMETVDGGWARNAALAKAVSNTFIGAGLGMAFETRAGIFNISYAGGKRDDSKFNLRQSKIHIGYVNYF